MDYVLECRECGGRKFNALHPEYLAFIAYLKRIGWHGIVGTLVESFAWGVAAYSDDHERYVAVIVPIPKEDFGRAFNHLLDKIEAGNWRTRKQNSTYVEWDCVVIEHE